MIFISCATNPEKTVAQRTPATALSEIEQLRNALWAGDIPRIKELYKKVGASDLLITGSTLGVKGLGTENYIEVITVLHELGYDHNTKNIHGMSLARTASTRNKNDVLDLLQELGYVETEILLNTSNPKNERMENEKTKDVEIKILLNTSNPNRGEQKNKFPQLNKSTAIVLARGSRSRGTMSVGKTGSGFFITENLFVTNLHVVVDVIRNEAFDVSIFAPETPKDTGKVVAFDSKNDIVLIKTARNDHKPLPLEPINSSTVKGDKVFTLTYPQESIESWINHPPPIYTEGFNQGSLSWGEIQVTAYANAGSSGGAAFNTEGEVIGVLKAVNLKQANHISFIEPINSVRALILESLQSLRGKGVRGLNRILQPETKLPQSGCYGI